uniref:Uncharacterized protein n=1 Tax=Arundo donax TaxID=35708 RepID=A0A0A9FLV5_ARUDO
MGLIFSYCWLFYQCPIDNHASQHTPWPGLTAEREEEVAADLGTG